MMEGLELGSDIHLLTRRDLFEEVKVKGVTGHVRDNVIIFYWKIFRKNALHF